MTGTHPSASHCWVGVDNQDPETFGNYMPSSVTTNQPKVKENNCIIKVCVYSQPIILSISSWVLLILFLAYPSIKETNTTNKFLFSLFINH